MYEAHPVFVQPDDPNVKVWRYMDFTKLVSLLDSRTLYFTRPDKFDDPFEGSLPHMDVAARQQMLKDLNLNIPEAARDNFAKALEKWGDIN